MTRILTESYELGTTALRHRSGAGSSVVSTAGLNMNGTYCVQLSNSNELYTNTGSDTDIFVAVFMRFSTITATADSSTSSRVLIFSTVSATEIASLRLNGITGRFALYTGTGTLVATGTQTISEDTTYHVQVRHKVDNAAGVLELYVNATLDATFTGDTQPAAETYDEYFGIYSFAGAHQSYMDDVILNNSLGSSDNTYPGIVRINRLLTTGPGNYVNNWTRNAGATNWEAVDEVPHDSDTTYLFTTTANIYESFSMADQALSSVTYKALITSVVAKKDSGTVQLAVGIRDNQNSTDYWGANSPLGVSYGIISERRTVDPSTGTTWTSDGINSTEALIASTTG